MSNSLLNSSIITRECLRELKNQLGFSKHVNRQYDDQFANKGGKIGASINIRKPARYTVSDGAPLVIQDSQDDYATLTLSNQKHVGMAFTTKDLTLSIDDFKKRYISPAMTALANKIDYQGHSEMYQSVYSFVGVPSATALPSTLKGFTQAKAQMALLGAPQDDLVAIVDPLVEASLVEGLKSLFQSSTQIQDQYEKGTMGIAAGCKFVSSANVAKHTSGSADGAPQVKTTITTQGTTTLAVDTITSATLTGGFKAGDVITIGSVYAVNPLTKQSTGQLMNFVVTADANVATNEASLTLSPPMYTTGALQNIDAFPQDNALVKVFGGASSAYKSIVCPQNMVFHKDAFVLGCADLDLPNGVDMAARASDPESGLSIRMIRDYDINNDRIISRLDVLYGWKCVYPEFACRVVGQPA